METYSKWDHRKPKMREDYNVTPEMRAPYIGFSKTGYELEFNKKDIFIMEKFIEKRPDCGTNLPVIKKILAAFKGAPLTIFLMVINSHQNLPKR